MSHILVLSLVFPPDNVSTAQLMGELVSDLSSAGNKVTVITTMPHFNVDHLAEADQPITRVWGRLLRRSSYGSAVVYHTAIPRKTGSKLKRLLGWGVFHVISTVAGFTIPRQVDVVISPSPPLTMGVGAWLLGVRHRAPSIYNVLELYPDIAVDLNVVRNRTVIALLHRLETFVYGRSAIVTASTPQIHTKLLERGVSSEKVVYIPNWVDTDALVPLPKDNSFSRQHAVDHEFVVNYAGNLGLAQNLDDFIDAAEELRGREGIRFMLIGDGVEKPRLERKVAELQLRNLLFLEHQSYQVVPLIYASCDLSYVSLHSRLDSDALPGKVYKIMSAGRAMLAVTRADSDLASLVNESGCGIIVEPGSPNEIARVILDAAEHRDRLEAMGMAGREHVKKYFSRKVVLGHYASLIESLASNPRR